MRLLILTTNNFEDSELRVSYDRPHREGVEVEIASERGGKVAGKHGYEVGRRFKGFSSRSTQTNMTLC